MCGVVDGGIVDGRWGYEAGQSGVGDLFGWFVEQRRPCRMYRDGGDAAGVDLHEHLTELAAAQAGRRARPARARLAQRQPLGPRQPRALRTDRRAHRDHPARGRLPRADRGDGVRGSHHRRRVRRSRRARRRVHRRRRALTKNRVADADLRRRAPPARSRSSVPHRARARDRRSTPPSPPAPIRTSRRRGGDGLGRRRPSTQPIAADADSLRRAVRRVHAAARPLRPRRQRRHAPAQQLRREAPQESS